MLWSSIESIICLCLEFGATHHSPGQVERTYLAWHGTFCLLRLHAHRDPAGECASLYQTLPRVFRNSSAQSTDATVYQSILAAWPEAGEEKALSPALLALVWSAHLHAADCSHQRASDHSFSHIGFCQLSGGKMLSNCMCKKPAGNVTSGIWWLQVYNGLPFHNARLCRRSLGIVGKA